MSDCRRQWNRENELPVYLAGTVTTGPNQRKSYGMFSSADGAYDSKTVDCDNFSAGRIGTRTPRSVSRDRLLDHTDGDVPETASEASEVRAVGSQVSSPGDREDVRPGVEIEYPAGRQCHSGQKNGKVGENCIFFSRPCLCLLKVGQIACGCYISSCSLLCSAVQ
ncbi:unnamed protein product [Oncorhynchus mykiss]|uniref:Uncharacterized protein n=1 Tax=Oncorhynchus mykiss TaxID=8022 RepID=A0A061A6P0_ONCMY|nr:unnamed protein product [Oncorhynchus mykiss]